MKRMKRLKFDEIGYWSELKIEIIKEYANAYTKILSGQKLKLQFAYVDGFSGAGVHVSKKTGSIVKGSPIVALSITPSFHKYYFVDLDSRKTEYLKKLIKGNSSAHVYNGDCNEILLKEVFPKIKYSDYRRGICLLDPYGLHLNWDVIRGAGQMKSLEIFLNFPIMDMNRNVFWRNPENVAPEDIRRMDAFWGDDSWRDGVVYDKKQDLFGYPCKQSNSTIAEHFKKRLIRVAGFKHVSNPLPMRNRSNSIIYYLFFASQKPVAKKIIDDIFKKYKNKMTKE